MSLHLNGVIFDNTLWVYVHKSSMYEILFLCGPFGRAVAQWTIVLGPRPYTQKHVTLTGVVQLVGHCPAKQKVTSSIPGQDTCLGCRFGPQSGCIREATTHWYFSPSVCPLPPHSKINEKIVLGWEFKKVCQTRFKCFLFWSRVRQFWLWMSECLYSFKKAFISSCLSK